MASRIRIAIDCMGGDLGASSAVPAAVSAVSQFSDIELVLIGRKNDVSSHLGDHSACLSIVHSDETVLMSDKPSVALRKKISSSMRIAIDLLAQKQVDAVVSAGNTGALMAMGCSVLKTLPGIDRPAICAPIPSSEGRCYLLDLGANVDSSAEQLHQFAIMGAALCNTVDGIAKPRVAVLNIGEEEGKGNEQVKLARQLIAADAKIHYIGSIEGDRLFGGEADVVVCDGFVGNVALKTSEGTASYINRMLKQQFNSGPLSTLLGWVATPVLNRLEQQLNPEQYNGASFLGLQGIVVKSHGNSSAAGFQMAIARARQEVKSGLLEAISARLLSLAPC